MLSVIIALNFDCQESFESVSMHDDLNMIKLNSSFWMFLGLLWIMIQIWKVIMLVINYTDHHHWKRSIWRIGFVSLFTFNSFSLLRMDICFADISSIEMLECSPINIHIHTIITAQGYTRNIISQLQWSIYKSILNNKY